MAVFSTGKHQLPLGERAYVMGILNVTPDSFSDGGLFFSPERAVRHALEMRDEGADIIDIGAQSTRPGNTRISPEQELERLLPVLKQLRDRLDIPVSVDTFYPQVAATALENGVEILNDVTGFDDPAMVDVAAGSDCGCIVMHHTGADSDIVAAVHQYFVGQLDMLNRRGIPSERICLDPGIGFGKTHEQNLQLLANVGKLRVGECALLIAASRKRVIGQECSNPPFEERLPGTIAAHSIAVADGADMVRAHDVRETVQSTRIASAIRRARIG
jgi:dihydropteroate synthase